MIRKKVLILLGSVCLALMLAVPMVASCAAPTPVAEEFPTRDIRAVVPWSAGGGCDSTTRKACYIAEQYLPVNIYVENIEGASSGLGVSQVMNSIPDGYNVAAMTYDSVITVPHKGLVPGYTLDRLQFICQLTTTPVGIIVRADSPWQTLDDLIQEMKRRPVTTGVASIADMGHMQGIKLEQAAGVDFKEIPFPEGAKGQKAAVLAGELEVTGLEGVADFYGLLESGELRMLAYFGATRAPGFPDVPTLIELGYDVTGGSFVILSTTAGIPPERLKILEDAFYKAQHSDEFQDWTLRAGNVADWLSSQETKAKCLAVLDKEGRMLDSLVEQGIIEPWE